MTAFSNENINLFCIQIFSGNLNLIKKTSLFKLFSRLYLQNFLFFDFQQMSLYLQHTKPSLFLPNKAEISKDMTPFYFV